MSDSKSTWGSFLGNYFKNTIHTKNPSEKKISTNYNEFEKTFYKEHEVIAKEPTIPDEEYQKEVELAQQYLPEVNEPIIEDQVEEVVVEQPIEQTTVDDVITAEELAEFARLNGIEDVKASLSEDGKTLEIEGNKKVTSKLESINAEIVIAEQPTETKVKSIKVSKSKDSDKEEKSKKPVKSSKAPKKPTKPKSKK